MVGQQIKQLGILIDSCQQYRKLCQSTGLKKESKYAQLFEQITQTAKVATKAKSELELDNQISIVKSIEKKSKKVKKKVTKNLKKQKVTDQDLDLVGGVLDLIKDLDGFYKDSADFLKEKFKKKYQKIKEGLEPQLKELYKKVEAVAPGKALEVEDRVSYKKQLAEIEKAVLHQQRKMEELVKKAAELKKEQAEQPKIPEGPALIEALD
ncbi:MAG: hypothetical protein GY810_22840 [Aureispira sp.]|nr:hypothetical protein [Aureispira sp.]